MDFLELHKNDLRRGLGKAAETYARKHAAWLAGRQGEGGGFFNRRGQEELYYTAFGLRGLAILNALTPDIANRAITYLIEEARQGSPWRTAIMTTSWWDALALCEEAAGARVADALREESATATCHGLNELRRDDGGWAKTNMEGNGSVYHTFLAACTYGRMDRELPEPERVDAFTRDLEQPEGGFLENRYSKRPGTNGTTAGIVLSVMRRGGGTLATAVAAAGWQNLPDILKRSVTRPLSRHGRFMLSLRDDDEGGFRATPNAPFADLLSTYTALFSLRTLGQLVKDVGHAAIRYARSLEAPGGGYAGFAMEELTDCEYTFYGLGIERIALELGV